MFAKVCKALGTRENLKKGRGTFRKPQTRG